MHTWRFRKMSLSEQNRNPVESEFFNRDDPVGALVREAIQNSLDALDPDGDGPVRVRFYIKCEGEMLPADRRAEWLNGLDPHLSATSIEYRSTPANGMPFVTVEDFGTRGLWGSTLAARKSELGSNREDFYYFWRNVGMSSLTEEIRQFLTEAAYVELAPTANRDLFDEALPLDFSEQAYQRLKRHKVPFAGTLKLAGANLRRPRSDDAVYIRLRRSNKDVLRRRFDLIRTKLADRLKALMAAKGAAASSESVLSTTGTPQITCYPTGTSRV